MRLETIPLIAGGLIALVGFLVILDAVLADYTIVGRERRRRPRRERSRGGEFMIGLGLLGMAGAFLGLDVWQYRIVSALAGTFFLLVGMLKNRRYFGEILRNRGAKRRAHPPIGSAAPTPGTTGVVGEPGPGGTEPSARPPRIR